MMRLSDFDYVLPKELIAQNPIEPRDAARLLVYNRETRDIVHATVSDLPDFLPEASLIVANNSKVRQSRLHAREAESGREYEILVLNALPGEEGWYECMIRGREPKPGSVFHFFHPLPDEKPIPLKGRLVRPNPGPEMTTFIFLLQPEGDTALGVEEIIERHGETPLPPYIHSSTASPSRYQTIFADSLGSAAAPTAGLHFTDKLMKRLAHKGHTWDEVTLHVGIGTFLPLHNESVEDNHLHTETTFVREDTAKRVNEQVQSRKTVLAVGTTSFRTLESHANGGTIVPGRLATDLFVYPGYRCQIVNALMTNFHLPKSSLLMLVSAVLANSSDRESALLTPEDAVATLHRLYRVAIENKYRFFSFGDAMLIL